MSVLSCDGKTWFSTAEQIAMGSGTAGPAYNKALALQKQAYAVRWTSPKPDATSAIAKLMDADLQAAASILATLRASPSTATIGSALVSLEALCSSIIANDTAWAATSGREPPTSKDVATCSFFHPFVCIEETGGVLLKWAAIGAVVYFGGKWLLGKTSTGRKLLSSK